MLKRDGKGVLIQFNGCSSQNFPCDANYKTSHPIIVNVSMSVFTAGNSCMAR